MTISATHQRQLGYEPLPELFQTNFSPEELASRRSAVFDRIGGDDIALLQGAPAPATSEFFRQTNDFFYLCGVEVPHAYLLLDGRTRATTLYLPHRDPAVERSEGRRLSAEDAEEAEKLTGIESVQGVEALSLDLQRLVLKRGRFRCYTPLSPAEQARAMRDQLLRAAATAASDPWDGASTREARFVRAPPGTLPYARHRRPFTSARPLEVGEERKRATTVAYRRPPVRTGSDRGDAVHSSPGSWSSSSPPWPTFASPPAGRAARATTPSSAEVPTPGSGTTGASGRPSETVTSSLWTTRPTSLITRAT